MKININGYNPEEYGIKFMQEGGEMPTEAPAEAPVEEPQGGEDPLVQIVQAAAQAVQTNDANLALQVCQALVQLAQGGAQEAAPVAPEGAQPVYRKGGRLAMWKKA